MCCCSRIKNLEHLLQELMNDYTLVTLRLLINQNLYREYQYCIKCVCFILYGENALPPVFFIILGDCHHAN